MFTMRNTLIYGALLAAAGVALAASRSAGAARADDGPQVAHSVFFKLKDSSGGSRAKLVATCKLLLTGHDGALSFATGTLAGDVTGPYNDPDYDVSLHLVFVNKASLDKYLAHPRHQKFVDENKENFDKIRVFDSYLSPAPPATTKAAPAPASAS
jgi:hypothetical protein